jgi:hypothetical protein
MTQSETDAKVGVVLASLPVTLMAFAAVETNIMPARPIKCSFSFLLYPENKNQKSPKNRRIVLPNAEESMH